MNTTDHNGKIKIFGASDCYGLTEELSFTLRLTYEMADAVDEACLRRAVLTLEKRFAYLKVSLRKNWHEFFYVQNSRPWTVVESDRAVPLNGKKSNGHLLALRTTASWTARACTGSGKPCCTITAVTGMEKPSTFRTWRCRTTKSCRRNTGTRTGISTEETLHPGKRRRRPGNPCEPR